MEKFNFFLNLKEIDILENGEKALQKDFRGFFGFKLQKFFHI